MGVTPSGEGGGLVSSSHEGSVLWTCRVIFPEEPAAGEEVENRLVATLGRFLKNLRAAGQTKNLRADEKSRERVLPAVMRF